MLLRSMVFRIFNSIHPMKELKSNEDSIFVALRKVEKVVSVSFFLTLPYNVKFEGLICVSMFQFRVSMNSSIFLITSNLVSLASDQFPVPIDDMESLM
ncbi:hypothetical protein Hdeb2414_s0005g00159031 [Helianthus debilis subsp. tardiflorus]